ncbi:nucleoporin NUP2-like isoform X2 [Panicum virgatum]|uniref:nucleoporin NUP2-like isoform X2 n=1 Tax=Panicum virgatum TaxID=38727 RepID=UPI0019D559CF|nr:nucleoporin NUP2-like isoform X2 [Panicum virgatum]
MTTRGAKRAATSDPGAPDLPSKRVMDGPSFDVHRAESSHQHVMAGPATLDPRRAEAASKHVRALNNQFASWVQLQLQNHPAELWEDGIKDYLSHASEIMEKFKDVVNWLRQNQAGSKAVSSPSPQKDGKTNPLAADDSKLLGQPSSDNAQKAPVMASSSSAFQNSSSPTPTLFSIPSKPQTPDFSGMFGDKKNTSGDSSKPAFQFGGNNVIFGDKKNTSGDSSKPPFQFGANNGIFGDKKNMPGESSKPPFQFDVNNGFSASNAPSLFSNSAAQIFSSQSPPLFSNQQSVLSGNQNASEASADADEDAEPEKPSSPSVKKAEEKGIVVVHEAKCKVYVKHDDATKGWKDIGVGQLSIRSKEGAEKASKESTPTIVIRNDVGKILLNALIYKGIKMNVQKNTVASIFHTSDAQSDESSSGAVVARTYLFRLKNEDEATKLSTAIKESAPLD